MLTATVILGHRCRLCTAGHREIVQRMRPAPAGSPVIPKTSNDGDLNPQQHIPPRNEILPSQHIDAYAKSNHDSGAPRLSFTSEAGQMLTDKETANNSTVQFEN